MKKFGYNLVKWWVKFGLYLYYGKIKISGLEHVPKDKPVLFLPNHQSALMDVLLIAVDCNRKPYFLTRSDVFKDGLLSKVFEFFQMIPIYRIRDGRESLKNNQAIFDRCSRLLQQKEAILMFPEANHNIKRRVRPLSKGFIRIIFNTLEKAPETDIQIIPIGINYRNSLKYPDKVALYFGKPISTKNSYRAADKRGSVERMKEKVSVRLQQLTTHIADDKNYAYITQQLDRKGADYLNPAFVNKEVEKLQLNSGLEMSMKPPKSGPRTIFLNRPFRALFILLNLPIVLAWKILMKPKVWEPEFTSTLRFGFALLAYPLYFFSLFIVLGFTINMNFAFATVFALLFFNWTYIRFF